MTASSLETQQDVSRQLKLLDAINRAQSTFISHSDENTAFEQLLSDLLSLTNSEYGFIGEVLHTPAGAPYLKTHAITNIAWNDATRAFYAENAPKGMEFFNLRSLFGVVLTSARPVIANDPYNDPRRGGLPDGHPPLNAFLGLPILVGDRLVAMAGISNRPGGYDQALVDWLQPLLRTIGQLVEARANQRRRQATEAAYAQTSALLASVLDSASEVSIIATGPQGVITVFNHGAERLLGYSADEMIGKQTPAVIHDLDEVSARGEVLSKQLGYLVAGFRVFVELPERQGSEQREWTYVRKSGERIPVSLVVTAMRDAAGSITGYLGIAQDITQRKHSETVLEEQARQTQAILDNMVDGLITIDRFGIIDSFNQAAARIFGYNAEEVQGRNVKMLMPNPHRDAHDNYLRNYQATGVARIIGIGREVEGQRKDGSLFPMELAVSEVTRKGAPLYVGIVRDISERKRMERMKSEFVSTVSHELRTPLTSISGALGLLAGGALGTLPEAMRNLIDIAHKNSVRLTHLINDLLDMEKIAAGKMHFDMQPQALMPLIEQAVETHRAYGAARRVVFAISHQAPGIEVRVDSQRLLQVLSNLLSNAVKYSPEDGTVEVAATPLAGRVRVSVTDRGPGIPAAFRPRIFQKFSQADSSDTRQKGGTGLGLAISKELVERMGGQVGFESEEGQGAIFHFELPLWNTQTSARDAVPLPDFSSLDSPRILVVEDEPDIAQLLALMLTRAGFSVDVAANGAEALERLGKERYAAMTLDLMLPDLSGMEIIRRVRQQNATSELPIVVVSAKMEEGRLAISGDFSGIDWLAKPVDEGRLLASVERSLAAHSGPRPRVLHVEDDSDLHKVVCAMAGERFDFQLAPSLAAARARLVDEVFDVVILDLGLPDGSGWDLVPTLRALDPAPRVVILSGTEMNAEETCKVEAALLKSRVSPRNLLDAIQAGIHLNQSNRKAS